MENVSRVQNRLKAFLGSREGNLAMTTAIVLPLLIGAAGVAIDSMNLMVAHGHLQEASDAAALAAVTSLAAGKVDETGAKSLAKDMVSGQMANYVDATTLAAIKLNTTVNVTTTTTASAGKKYDIVVGSAYDVAVTPLTGVIKGTKQKISASSNSTSSVGTTKTALSMEVLLDESGSMADNTNTVKSTKCVLQVLNICLQTQTIYVTKIEALKQAAASLFDALDKVDPSAKLVRTGAISYANGTKGQSDIDWGTTGVRRYVTNMTLTPTGGTDANAPMLTADNTLKKNAYGTDPESVAHAKKGNTNANRLIVLMTDGEMTGNSTLWNRGLDQDLRDKCALAKADGITIYTVAFMAPDNGKSLLKFCASSPTNYYEPDTMDALVSAFASIGQSATKPVTRLTQ